MSDTAFLNATRDSYDVMAVDYAHWLRSDLETRPLDRALLAAFAERITGTGGGPVADVGCGPGRVTILLHRLGLDAFGIDLSPAMVTLARNTYPDLRFEVGSMLDLALPDASLGGLLAYYSIIHVPWARRAQVLAEFHRVLVPGGQLMLAFQVGDHVAHHTQFLGNPIDLHVHRQRPEELTGLLRAAGFTLWATVVKEPEGTEKTPQGYLLAGKPDSTRTG